MSEVTKSAAPGSGDSGESTRNVDIVSALVLGGLSVFALLWLIPANTQPGGSEHDVTPGFFPILAVSIVLLLSIVLAICRWFQRADAAESGFGVIVELALYTMASIAMVLALSQLGFLVMAPALLAIAMVFSGNRNWWLILSIAVLFPPAVDWAAWLIFSVDLP